MSISDGEDSRQLWELTNPICLSAISKRKSAFLPYKPNIVSKSLATTETITAANTGLNSCVLTNLQRGNTEALIGGANIVLSFHERCGQGEVTESEVLRERNHPNGGLLNAADEDNGYTALHWASHYGQLHTIQLLCKHGANVNCEAPEYVTPLHLAAAGGHHEVVKCLLQHGANAIQKDIIGNTALMYAAAGNHPHTTNELLTGHMHNLMATNEHDDSAYSLAVKYEAGLSLAVLEHYIVSMLTV